MKRNKSEKVFQSIIDLIIDLTHIEAIDTLHKTMVVLFIDSGLSKKEAMKILQECFDSIPADNWDDYVEKNKEYKAVKTRKK